MLTLIWIATGLVITAGSIFIYAKYKDAIHPGIILAPLFIYQFSVSPILMNLNDGLFLYHREETYIYSSSIYLVTIVAFYLGLGTRGKTQSLENLGPVFSVDRLDQAQRRHLVILSCLLGGAALVSFWTGLANAGGFFAAYGGPKGGGFHKSGYLGETILLSFPALVVGAIALRGRRLLVRHMVAALIVASPHLIHGTFGGRRGPIFLILLTLFLSWAIQQRRKLSFMAALGAVAVAGSAVIAVWSQRRFLYLGSGQGADAGRILEFLVPGRIHPGETYVFGTTSMLVADLHNSFYWGYRYFVTIFIRPIPKQIWPTKYEDMGADWLLLGGIDQRADLYKGIPGYVDTSGFAMPSIADGYMEFQWGVVLLFLVLGRFLGWVWSKHKSHGAFWSVIYAATVPLTIYLATQSVTAFLVRFLFIFVAVSIMWKLIMGKSPADVQVRGLRPSPRP